MRDDVGFILALIELGNVDGDHVYQSPDGVSECQYVHQDESGEYTEPGCVVGAALIKDGVPIDRVRLGNSSVYGGSCLMSASELLYNLMGLYNLSDDVIQVASECQSRQDRGRRWWVAVEPARLWLENHRREHYNG